MVMLEKSEGKFLKAADLVEGDILIFEDGGKDAETMFGKKFQIGVSYKGESKVFTMNNTSKNNMIDAYGGNTNKWLEKRAMVTKELMPTGVEFVALVEPDDAINGNEDPKNSNPEPTEEIPF